ncbi:Fpg/Nei family DNA glycosylase [bacterium]|nr:Fpg/Nei family DNA glycosylase [bacterium]
MPELPEIMSRAREMKRALVGRTITDIEIIQPKCLNVTPRTFRKRLTGAKIQDVTHHGKWIFTRTSQGDLLLTKRDRLPEKYQFIFDFDDGKCMSVRFWWFGYVHYVADGKLDKHEMTAKLGPNVLDVTLDEFREMLEGRRGGIKTFLLNQERIAGIGNAYVHDILFLARLHPLRGNDTLKAGDVERLWEAIQQGLKPAAKKGGAYYEKRLSGKPGGFLFDDILIGYREGQPCPECGAKIVKLKTGSTHSYICPKCQSKKRAAPRKRAAGRKKAGKGKR